MVDVGVKIYFLEILYLAYLKGVPLAAKLTQLNRCTAENVKTRQVRGHIWWWTRRGSPALRAQSAHVVCALHPFLLAPRGAER